MLSQGDILRGRYKIESFLGRGGMADVYLAVDMRRRVYVAIKVLREDFAEDLEFVNRFQREAEALAHLDHPYIVRFYSFEREGLVAFIVMDYVKGKTLRRRIAEEGGPLPIQEVTQILDNIGAALQYAHNEGYIHRDIKPGNIMIRDDGVAVLTDFGIARAAESSTLTLGQIGTPAYMSPEQILGHRLDYRTDIYSLGVVLFEMVTGKRPFTVSELSMSTNTIERIRYAHLHLPPPDPRKFNPVLSEAASQVILRALAKQPQERWPTVAAMVEAWKAATGIRPKAMRPYSNSVEAISSDFNKARSTTRVGIVISITLGAVGILSSIYIYATLYHHGVSEVTPTIIHPLASNTIARSLREPTNSNRVFPDMKDTSSYSYANSGKAKVPISSRVPTFTPTPALTPTLTPTSTLTPTTTPTPTSTPTPFFLAPGLVYQIHRSILQDIFDSGSYLGKILFEVNSIYVGDNGKTITIRLYWTFLPDKNSSVNKVQRINSHKDIWLVDDLGKKYIPIEFGGILAGDTAILSAGDKVEGWVVFPMLQTGATRLTYHGDGETLSFSLVK